MLNEHARLASALRDKIAGYSDRDRWIGLDIDGKFAAGQSLAKVMDCLKEQGAEDGTLAVEFLSAEPMEWTCDDGTGSRTAFLWSPGMWSCSTCDGAV